MLRIGISGSCHSYAAQHLLKWAQSRLMRSQQSGCWHLLDKPAVERLEQVRSRLESCHLHRVLLGRAGSLILSGVRTRTESTVFGAEVLSGDLCPVCGQSDHLQTALERPISQSAEHEPAINDEVLTCDGPCPRTREEKDGICGFVWGRHGSKGRDVRDIVKDLGRCG